MTKQLIPVGHRILVRVDKVEEVSAGGIVLAKSHVDREQSGTESGTIIAVGPHAWYDKPGAWAKKGDRVLFVRYAGHMVDGEDYGYPGEKLRAMNDEDLLSVVRDDEAA